MTDIDVLLDTLRLKDETRTGWQLRDVDDPESVAAHSWGTAFLCLLFGDEEDVDVDRCLRVAVVHDLAEAETGDPAFRDQAEKEKQEVSEEEKTVQERAAMTGFADGLDDDQLLSLWTEYEEQETGEARFVKDMNMIDMCLQALLYEQDRRYTPDSGNDAFDEYDRMDEFFATTENRLSTATGKDLFTEIYERYEEVKG